MYRRAERLFDTFYGVKDDARPAGTKEDGSDHHVQAIKTPGRKKARNSVGAAFNENTAEAEFGKSSKDDSGCNVSIRGRKCEHLNAGQRTRCSLRRYHQPACAVTVEQACSRLQTSARIEDNASRMRTGDPANRELRIVSKSGSDPDNDSVNDRAQAM
jgi:hypothetical protein